VLPSVILTDHSNVARKTYKRARSALYFPSTSLYRIIQLSSVYRIIQLKFLNPLLTFKMKFNIATLALFLASVRLSMFISLRLNRNTYPTGRLAR
jgi:hypothetical protein